mmetsp:Transcript_3905/g.9643  ORF Transcript_3905/g.9643 Transcript_3905/m.9643 type:complete len:129 (-) Transcript_3905:121-507(-)
MSPPHPGTVTNRQSWNAVEAWIAAAELDPSTPKFLIGNKIDSEGQRELSSSRGESFAQKHHMTFYEASARSGQGVSAAFNAIFAKITNSLPSEPDPSAMRGKGIEIGSRIVNDEETWMAMFATSAVLP